MQTPHRKGHRIKPTTTEQPCRHNTKDKGPDRHQGGLRSVYMQCRLKGKWLYSVCPHAHCTAPLNPMEPARMRSAQRWRPGGAGCTKEQNSCLNSWSYLQTTSLTRTWHHFKARGHAAVTNSHTTEPVFAVPVRATQDSRSQDRPVQLFLEGAVTKTELREGSRSCALLCACLLF